MLQGGFAGVGMQVCKSGDEETEDVVVDGDDTATFGPSQFGENDILSATEHSSRDEGTKCIFVYCQQLFTLFINEQVSRLVRAHRIMKRNPHWNQAPKITSLEH